MKPTSKSYIQLQPEERVTLASLHQQAYSVRAMAQALQRSPSTISRELIDVALK
jgi:transposase, IS30 family